MPTLQESPLTPTPLPGVPGRGALQQTLIRSTECAAPILQGRPDRARFRAWYTPAWRHGTAVAVLFLVVFVTYRPALRHPPRQDQWTFLLETVNADRFVPLVLQHVLVQPHRRGQLGGLSALPPRPVRPAVRGEGPLRRSLHLLAGYGDRPALSRSSGYSCASRCRLHAAYPAGSAWAGRLRLALAYVLALFFAVNFAGTEMVIWHHIHGYLLFVLLVLGSWLLLLDELCDLPAPRGRSWRLGGALLLTLLSAFTYETGAYYAVCLGGVLALVSAGRRRFRRGLVLFALFAAVLPVFRAADWLDRRSHRHTQPDVTEATVWEHARWEPTTEHAKRYLLFTLCQPFFPSCPEWSFADRLFIPEPGSKARALLWRLEPFLFVSYAVVLARPPFSSRYATCAACSARAARRMKPVICGPAARPGQPLGDLPDRRPVGDAITADDLVRAIGVVGGDRVRGPAAIPRNRYSCAGSASALS